MANEKLRDLSPVTTDHAHHAARARAGGMDALPWLLDGGERDGGSPADEVGEGEAMTLWIQACLSVLGACVSMAGAFMVMRARRRQKQLFVTWIRAEQGQRPIMKFTSKGVN